jgi:hypothetical protein
MVESSIVFVNTRNIVPADQTSQNNVTVNLDEPIFVPDDHDCMLSVNQAQIPNSFYTFTEPLTFTVRWNQLSKTITVTNVGTNWITVDSKTNLFVGQQINIQSGTGFGGLQPSTSYFISEIDPTGNRIRLKDFVVQPTIISSATGSALAVASFNHIARTITLVNASTINVGDLIQINTTGSGWSFVLPPNLWYYVISKNGNTITISDRQAGIPLYPSGFNPGIFMNKIAFDPVQVIAVNTTNERIQLGTLVGLNVGDSVTFTETFCGVVAGGTYQIRTLYPDTQEIDINSGGTLQGLSDVTIYGFTTTVQVISPSGSITAKLSTTQKFTIDTSVTAPSSALPGGSYTQAMFGVQASGTNALFGKTLAFTNGTTSTLTLACTVTTNNQNSLLTSVTPGKPALVPKFNLGFTASAGALADFTIDNFTYYPLGFENQTIVGTGTQAVSQPMFSPRYVLIGSSLRTPGQVPGGKVRFNPIATIPMQTTFGSVQSYIPPFPSEQKIDDQTIRSFTLQLYDELGNPLNFNGVEWQAVLEFKMYPKRKPEYKYSW